MTKQTNKNCQKSRQNNNADDSTSRACLIFQNGRKKCAANYQNSPIYNIFIRFGIKNCLAPLPPFSSSPHYFSYLVPRCIVFFRQAKALKVGKTIVSLARSFRALAWAAAKPPSEYQIRKYDVFYFY